MSSTAAYPFISTQHRSAHAIHQRQSGTALCECLFARIAALLLDFWV